MGTNSLGSKAQSCYFQKKAVELCFFGSGSSNLLGIVSFFFLLRASSSSSSCLALLRPQEVGDIRLERVGTFLNDIALLGTKESTM